MDRQEISRVHDQMDSSRHAVSKLTTRERKSEFGQFLTPYSIARFMASLFTSGTVKRSRLLDPGAGLGALSGAFIERWTSGELPFTDVEVTAFELDEHILQRLLHTRDRFWTQPNLSVEIHGTDFIEAATLSVAGFARKRLHFTHAILNPPYKKILSASRHRQLLRKAGIETVNLYSGFLALVIQLMEVNGEIVAIIPRSFCNGPYYRAFRHLLLDETAIHRIHLFASRTSAFKDDSVLQENVIIFLKKRGLQGDVTISTSTDDTFTDMKLFHVPFSTVVRPGDEESFIHVPLSTESSELDLSTEICHSLSDIRVEVSTGPVVDFRVKRQLRAVPEPGTVPLLYPTHFLDNRTVWPRLGQKKANALVVDSNTERWLYPTGFYTVVRRFSSKEEKRRIVANFVSPSSFGASYLGFENHLNVFHNGKRGLQENIALGLSAFLNSTLVDQQFRRFNGHTQVNATDLRAMKYPSEESLIRLGQWSKGRNPTQVELDMEIRRIA